MAGVIFFLDVFSPPAVAWWILYLFPLLLAFSLPHRMAPALAAAIATALISIGAFLPGSSSPDWPALVNRALAIAVLWGTITLIRQIQDGHRRPSPQTNSIHHDDQRELRHLFGERVKELTALHRTVHLLQDSTKPIEEVLSQIVALMPPAWQYPEITLARITFGDLVFTTPNFVESPWKQTASWVTLDGANGTIEVVYREGRPPEIEGPFLAEERDLMNSLADSLCSYLNRRRAELALREAHERMQALSQQLMEVQESERRRLALDLHDEIGQALTVVKMNLQTIQRCRDTSDIANLLKDSSTVIDQTLHHVRDLSLELRPSLLDDLGLVPAVRWYLSRQAERAGWNLDVQVDESLSPPQSVAIACFRVIQEAVTNVIRHSNATRITVSLQKHEGDLLLLIRDNGRGFEVQKALAEATSGQSMGLLGMQERIRFLNGTISIDSNPGHGTEVRVRVPLSLLSSSPRTEAST
ncbi:MAG: Two-component system sensor histidine kinase [Nitrospira sp.]|nr:MAG: Two-component system sensor histidine kinase [Nitrospira sp.]